ncbi:MAG: hypothetical protein HFJ49_01045 [Clostridia bacterium]|jgi:hypothetical protein|nr:hypothetical protein [Clostridia bacterium]
MKLVLLGFMLIGAIIVGVFIKTFTHNSVEIFREYKRELDIKEKYFLKIALKLSLGIDIIYIIIEIPLIRFLWDLFKATF